MFTLFQALIFFVTAAAAAAAAQSTSTSSTLFNVTLTNLTFYNDKLLLYTIQGLVNRDAPMLFFDTGTADMDFPQSDQIWAKYLTKERNVHFNTSVTPTLCHLIAHFQSTMDWKTVVYRDDTYSSHLAATVAGIHGNYLPASNAVMARHSCLKTLPIGKDFISIAKQHFFNKTTAYRWAIVNLLPYTSKDVLFNADNCKSSR